MQPRVWGTSDDGTLEYVSLTSERLQDGLDIMLNSFFVHENVCIASKLPEYREAIPELKDVCLKAAKDGASIIAVEKSTGKVAGIVLNTLRVQSNVRPTYYEQYRDKVKHPAIKSVLNFLVAADDSVDVYQLCNTNCSLEISFVATLPEFRGKGIAKKFFELSIKLGQALLAGENVRVPVDGNPLPDVPPPTIMSVLATSPITQHLARKFGFIVAIKIDYEKFSFEGESFASRIGAETPFATVEYLKLTK